jgi:predicted NBD/HSP70 family sugar kinase
MSADTSTNAGHRMSGTAAVTIGIDVGGTNTRVGVVAPDGSIVACSTTATRRGADDLSAHLVAEIRAAIGAADAPIDAIGVGIPGHIDPASKMLSTAVNLGIDAPTPLWHHLECELGLPVSLSNDVDAASLAAFAHLGGIGDLAYVSVGTGLAAGIVIDGRLRSGPIGAGEIGHLPAPGGDEACRCGQIGCAETMASGGAMLRAWGSLDATTPTAGLSQLWDAAQSGDARARRIRERCVDTLAWVIQGLVVALDVDHVVLGGGVSRLGGRLVGPITEVLDRRAVGSPFLAAYRIADRVSMAPPGSEFGVVGAALAARTALASGVRS